MRLLEPFFSIFLLFISSTFLSFSTFSSIGVVLVGASSSEVVEDSDVSSSSSISSSSSSTSSTTTTTAEEEEVTKTDVIDDEEKDSGETASTTDSSDTIAGTTNTEETDDTNDVMSSEGDEEVLEEEEEELVEDYLDLDELDDNNDEEVVENSQGTEEEGEGSSEATTTEESTEEKEVDESGGSHIEEEEEEEEIQQQTGPFIDLLGGTLLSLEMIDETRAQFVAHRTNDALEGKKVVGLYFSADWCGPCKQFTPELVSFYNKMNTRKGKREEFEIVWISKCRDANSYAQYFTHMNWLAMPPELAMDAGLGDALSAKYGVKGIPTLVLLDEDANVITTEGRIKIPEDRAGIGFPWRNPIVSLYLNFIPKPLRLLMKSSVIDLKEKILLTIKGAFGMKVSPAAAA